MSASQYPSSLSNNSRIQCLKIRKSRAHLSHMQIYNLVFLLSKIQIGKSKALDPRRCGGRESLSGNAEESASLSDDCVSAAETGWVKPRPPHRSTLRARELFMKVSFCS